MSEELELTGGASGIDRRDFIRKTAIVGGMVWAAPMIQSIGSPAFAFSPGGFFDGFISDVAFLIKNELFNYKYEEVDGFCAAVGDGSAQPCVIGLMGRDDKWGDFYDEWVLPSTTAGTTDDGRVTVSCGEDNFTIDPTSLYSVRFIAVKAGTQCFYKDTSGLAKDVPVVIPNSQTGLNDWADLII